MLVVSLIFAFLAVWTALYFLVIRPKLESFRYTAGIYAQLDAWEAGLWPKLALMVKGAKVAIIGFITSTAPVLAVFYDQVAGLDWERFLPTERAKIIAGVVTALGVIGPMIMVVLHNGALAAASAASPVEAPPADRK